MIQHLYYDEDENPVFEFDQEGINHLMDGLCELDVSEVGTVLTTPTLWVKDPPWWRFWNRKPDPVIGEMMLVRVEDRE